MKRIAFIFASILLTAFSVGARAEHVIHCADAEANYFGGFFIDISRDKDAYEMNLTIGAVDSTHDFIREDELPKLTPGKYQGSLDGDTYHFDRFTVKVNKAKPEVEATVWYDKELKQSPYTFYCL